MIFTTDKMIDTNNSTTTSTAPSTAQFVDCLIDDVDVDNQISKTNESDYMHSRYLNQTPRQSQYTPLTNYQKNKANYNVKLSSDYISNMNRFQYVLMAPTSPAVKMNEDTLTYLNQGQNYELKLSSNEIPISQTQLDQNYSSYQNEDIKPFINLETKTIETRSYLINNQSDSTTLNQIVRDPNEHDLNDKLHENNNQNLHQLDSNGASMLTYLSVVRVCFWDRKLQEMEQEEIKEWEKEYPNMRMLEIDSNSSYGIIEVRMSESYINAAEILWNGRTGANIFFRCNCTSTAFAPHKHGGEKGIHMRFQIDTFEVTLQNQKINFTNELLSYQSNQSGNNSSSNSIASILSPPNSTSSPNSIKFIKDDLDSSNMNRKIRTPTPSNQNRQWLEFSEVKHLAGSYCRIQLFRLKGAQRKLKTDRSKIERLNPPDLRKRYQPSNKITLLNNCSYDWLYSLLPFVKESQSQTQELNHHHHHHHHNNNNNNHHLHEIDSFQSSNSQYSHQTDYITNGTYSQTTNSSSFVQQNHTYPTVHNSNLEFMNTSHVSQNQYLNHYTSLDMPPINSQTESSFYLDNSYTQINQNNMVNNQIQSNNLDYGYNRMKRASSFSSMTNYPTYKPSKIQKTSNLASSVSSPQVFNIGYNNMSSLASSSSSSSSSASSSSSLSSPASPSLSPLVNLQQHQISANQTYTQIDYSNNTISQQSSPLPYDCSNKYVQEWLVQNRFFNLLSIFSNYTSNDILRLTKEDLITLCGSADGIRCYNMAHNIQIKPKLTIFVTFQNQSYYSAIFLTESKSNFLISKIFNVYSALVKSLKNNKEEKLDKSDMENNDEHTSDSSENENLIMYEKMINGIFEYELFIKAKGVLVKTTDEVLNNLDDQSKFMIEFQIADQNVDMNKTVSVPAKLNCLTSQQQQQQSNSKQRPNLVKIIMIPLD